MTEFTIQGVILEAVGWRRRVYPWLVMLLLLTPVLLASAVNFLAPDSYSISLFGRALMLDRLRQGPIGRSTTLVAALACVALAEGLVVGWRHSSLRVLLRGPTPSMWSDIVVFLTQHCKVSVLLQFAATFGLVTLMTRYAVLGGSSPVIQEIALSHWPLCAQFVILYGVYTFGDYWAHRLSHAPIIWPLHRFHHAAKEFCIFTYARVHAAEIVGAIIVNIPLILLRPSPAVLGLLWSLVIYLRMAIHSRLPWKLGWLGETLVQSPAHHRLHHQLDHGNGATNYSLCPLWDRLFGTWQAETPDAYEIGVDCHYRHGAWFMSDFIRDYIDVFTGIAQRLTAPRSTAIGLRR